MITMMTTVTKDIYIYIYIVEGIQNKQVIGYIHARNKQTNKMMMMMSDNNEW